MTSSARYQPLIPDAGTRIDLATRAESGAVAEVQAAVLVAHQRPRSKAAAVAEMRDATAQATVAELAFFRHARGDGVVTGVSIHLARELARCWGNIDHGVKELRRDDDTGKSEMLAHAWDLETNARSSTTFIVAHVRDTRTGSRQLTTTADIYENNANHGSRRLREQILAVLPRWFVEEAKANCHATLERGDGNPLEQRRAAAIARFAELGVTAEQLEAKVGAATTDWTGTHLGNLAVIYRSLQRGEIARTEEFVDEPTQADTAAIAELLDSGRDTDEDATDPAPPPASPDPPSPRPRRARREPEPTDTTPTHNQKEPR